MSGSEVLRTVADYTDATDLPAGQLPPAVNVDMRSMVGLTVTVYGGDPAFVHGLREALGLPGPEPRSRRREGATAVLRWTDGRRAGVGLIWYAQ